MANKLVRQSRRRALGGKFIYSGSYGCTFKPALRCKGSNTRKNGYISKVIESDDGAKELRIASTVRALNRNFKYFVYPDDQCRPAKPNNADEFPKCTLAFSDPVLLQSPYGGVDLQHIKFPYEDIPAFFTGFLNIFDGVALLHKNKYVHKDIKLTNIVGLKSNGKYLLRLIDFGLSSPFSLVIENPNTDNYGYWPYDMRFLDDGFLQTAKDTNDFLKSSDFFEFPMWFFENKNGTSKITIKFGLELMKKIREGGDEAKETMIKASDVYAIGRALYESYVLVTSYISTAQGEFIKLEPEMPDVPAEVTLAMHALVYKMCNPDPFSRATLEEAKIEFMSVLDKMRQ